MSNLTPRMGFYKPEPGENVNVTTDLNNNWDLIDAMCGFAQCTSTTRPSVVWPGLCIFETDTEQTYVSNGSSPASGSWISIPNGTSVLESTGVNIIGATANDSVVNIQVAGEANNRLTIDADGTFLWGSGDAAGDTNLYRNGSSALRTDDTLEAATFSTEGVVEVQNGNAGAAVITATVTGDTVDRFAIYANGDIGWGSGGAARDVFLTRTGPGELTVPNDLIVTGDLSVGGIGQVRFVDKSAATQRNNTTTLEDDPELSLTVDANSTYEVEFWLAVATNALCGLRTSWNVPVGITGLKSCFGATETSSGFNSREDTRVRLGVHNLDTSTGYSVDTSTFHQWTYERALVNTGGTAGTITLQWCQNVINPGYVELSDTSYMKVTKVA